MCMVLSQILWLQRLIRHSTWLKQIINQWVSQTCVGQDREIIWHQQRCLFQLVPYVEDGSEVHWGLWAGIERMPWCSTVRIWRRESKYKMLLWGRGPSWLSQEWCGEWSGLHSMWLLPTEEGGREGDEGMLLWWGFGRQGGTLATEVTVNNGGGSAERVMWQWGGELCVCVCVWGERERDNRFLAMVVGETHLIKRASNEDSRKRSIWYTL